MRVIGLDWGTVRVGVAMSDEEAKLAFPLQHTLEAQTAIKDIVKMIEEYQVSKIVLGLPVSMQGSETDSTVRTKKFAEKLSAEVKIPIETVDERLSSVASAQALHQQGLATKDHKAVKDNIAAALMLQQYLDIKNKS
jgi:putative Holliday junction resolvase